MSEQRRESNDVGPTQDRLLLRPCVRIYEAQMWTKSTNLFAHSTPLWVNEDPNEGLVRKAGCSQEQIVTTTVAGLVCTLVPVHMEVKGEYVIQILLLVNIKFNLAVRFQIAKFSGYTVCCCSHNIFYTILSLL